MKQTLCSFKHKSVADFLQQSLQYKELRQAEAEIRK